MNRPFIIGVVSTLFGLVSLGGAISGNVVTAGGFGLAAGLMGLAAAIAADRGNAGSAPRKRG
ncbi:hypothetical protein F7D09_1509 [Bifidobacterium leontopitheci]|uniref:Uncharacterized protein n=2 Tax=Bifidobacterium leontopitheci TaxID=2650774 RepID=A0A6I1GKI4_9BIFI|nr:hypothetical protein F7D09_1509 [Bifidobacterium leontopitheci]